MLRVIGIYELHRAAAACEAYLPRPGEEGTVIGNGPGRRVAAPTAIRPKLIAGRYSVPGPWAQLCSKHPSLGWMPAGLTTFRETRRWTPHSETGEMVGTVFLHSRTGPDGVTLLVAVDSLVETDSVTTLEVGFVVTTIRDEGPFKLPRVVRVEHLESPRFRISPSTNLLFWRGTPDSANGGRFIFSALVDGVPDVFEGDLLRDGAVVLRMKKRTVPWFGIVDLSPDGGSAQPHTRAATTGPTFQHRTTQPASVDGDGDTTRHQPRRRSVVIHAVEVRSGASVPVSVLGPDVGAVDPWRCTFRTVMYPPDDAAHHLTRQDRSRLMITWTADGDMPVEVSAAEGDYKAQRIVLNSSSPPEITARLVPRGD